MRAELKLLIKMAWPELNSPCLWEHVNIPVHLGFLGILLVLFLRKCVGIACQRRRSIGPDQSMHKYSIGVKFSTAYKATIVCSILLLGVHFLGLLMLLNGQENRCTSKLCIFISDHATRIISNYIDCSIQDPA